MKRILTILVVVALVPAAAHAASFTVWTVSENPGQPYITLNAPGMLANGQLVSVGSLTFRGDLGTFDGYCVDINHYINAPGGPYSATLDFMSNWGVADATVKSASSPTDAATRAAYLFNMFAGLNSSLLSGFSLNEQRWGLQVAVWDALYDNTTDYNVLTGAFSIGIADLTFAGVSAANMMLQSLRGYAGTDNATWLRLANSGTGTQDFIARVPEPGSMLLLGVGLFGMAWAARKRLRNR